MSHDFWEAIPDDCKKAVRELKRMKVFNLCAWDHEDTFADVWWLVLHEVDMYEEGEFCMEASRNYGGYREPAAMNLRQAQTADRWLVRWWELANKYSRPEYCPKDGMRHWGEDGIEYYSGQLL